ncbi:hypothetical protein J0895_00465 [Phormidium pseudopriestleyi FRX01]|uniref:Uncharacterized protein n=1 Tax=Phormidium pseudopriestleyi FRX01 TaxID=1759528 RepID=A0ABS3FKU3_9CYAN|nr:hypothetical protein [Phormidium pseudopriestleyi]MBO0347604.1 hypothetical protein [Phormidium pseudopriestleyi FRX01]
MTGLDWIVIAVYLICVSAVLLRAFSSLLAEKVLIKLDENFLKNQLETQNLENRVRFKFFLAPQYDLDQFRVIEVSVQNQSPNQTLYIDWDYSALIDAQGREQRLVRLPPGMTFDLLPAQVFSVIAPGKTLQEVFTAESALKREGEIGPLKPDRVMLNLASLKPNPRKQVSPKAELPCLTFTIQFALRFGMGEHNLGNLPLYLVNCRFQASVLPWVVNIPWNKRRDF